MFEGRPDGNGRRIAIVVSRFNDEITSRLADGATGALLGAGVTQDDLLICYVPGAFELPIVARQLAASGRFDAVVALGAVIRGETDHYDYVCAAAQQGILQASLATGVPIMFGVLTCDTDEQALARCGGDVGATAPEGSSHGVAHGASHGASQNKGADVALDALRMADLLARLPKAGRSPTDLGAGS